MNTTPDVEGSWYHVTRISDSVRYITEPRVDPLLRANIWHVRGRTRDLIVDTGLGVVPLRSSLPQLFERDPLVVVTHAHLDHMGGAHEFDSCLAHPAESIRDPDRGSLHGPTLAIELGLEDEELPESLLTELPSPGYDPRSYALEAPSTLVDIDEGDVLDLGDRHFEVLHLPGHSPGSIALFESRSGTLFSGDVVYDLTEDEALLDQIRGASIADYVLSLERLRQLPIVTVFPGHGRPIDGRRLREICEDYITTRSPHTRPPT